MCFCARAPGCQTTCVRNTVQTLIHINHEFKKLTDNRRTETDGMKSVHKYLTNHEKYPKISIIELH